MFVSLYRWPCQVKDGRLGLHEKSMPICGPSVAGVCEWRPTNWTAAKNAGLSTTAGLNPTSSLPAERKRERVREIVYVRDE